MAVSGSDVYQNKSIKNLERNVRSSDNILLKHITTGHSQTVGKDIRFCESDRMDTISVYGVSKNSLIC